MKIVWSETAVRDLGEIRAYIAEHNPKAAHGTAMAIIQAANRLADFPASGRMGRIADTRELVIANLPFILPYTVNDGEVVILAAFHEARKWPDKL
ncbi:MAG: type II toxin-antitoxin system RelE/ParE family toxin [Rhodospirillales bacterium]